MGQARQVRGRAQAQQVRRQGTGAAEGAGAIGERAGHRRNR
jgi:hypothetical protein